MFRIHLREEILLATLMSCAGVRSALIAAVCLAFMGVTAAAGGEPIPFLVLEGEGVFGYSVSAAGDVNGDGFKDAIVGAPYTSGDIGSAYVFFGGSTADDIADLTLNGDPGVHLFGLSVSGAGDVNADGFDDVIVGAVNSPAMDIGRAYLFLGGAVPDETADLVLFGEDVTDWFGSSVSKVGDLNDDGYDDVIVGAPGNDYSGFDAGRAYVYFGGPSLDADGDVVLNGEGTDDWFGYSVSGAGDVNGDGNEDLIVGARSNNVDEAGRAYLYYGGPGFDALADLALTENTQFPGFAHSVSGAVDVNGDGFDEMIVGHSRGEIVRVYYGVPQPDATPLADLTLTSEAVEEWLGKSVSGAGDLNGDNYADVLVGAPANDAKGDYTGRAYVFFGGSSPDEDADVTFTGESEQDFFGEIVSGLGDFNGDSFDDLIIGTLSANRAYVYLGGPALTAGSDVTGVAIDSRQVGQILLSSPRPNPLHGARASFLEFTLDRSSMVRLLLQDIQGRTVAQRESESFTSGTQSVSWNPGGLPSGVYYLRIEADGDAASTKWVIVR